MLVLTQMSRRERAAWWKRWTAVLIAALPLLGQLSGGLHLFAVEHVVCPVHGELLHGAEAPLASAPDAAAARADDGAPKLAPHEQRRHRGHETCELALATRDLGLGPSLGAARTSDALERVAQAAPPSAAAIDAFARYLLAPKQSPPV
jgi:hypothetical protein